MVFGLVWLVQDRSVGGTEKDRMGSTAPACIERSAIVKTGVALCAPKKRNTWPSVFAANSSLELHGLMETDVPSRIGKDPAVDASF